jgi:hypothetical protein
MDNRIRQITVDDRSLVPAEAEVWITATPQQHTPTTELRGRLMGPRCIYASTVEVAYPLRPLPPGRTPPGTSGPTMRVVIPEASLWEPESPFLYQGPVELWQDGQRCDQMVLSHGLRSVHLGDRGLRLNSRPLTLRGRCVSSCSDPELRALRQAGYNLLLAGVAGETLPLWEQADRMGFLVLGQVRDDREETVRRLESLSRHASCLGWLVEDSAHPPLDLLASVGLLGLACVSPPRVPAEPFHFLMGPAALANLGKPLLVRGEVPGTPAGAGVILGSVK